MRARHDARRRRPVRAARVGLAAEHDDARRRSSVPAGQFTPPGLRAARRRRRLRICLPSAAWWRRLGCSNSDVKFEVWLPTQGWTGDFMPAGSTFWGGPIPFARMREVLHTGAVTVGTNLGIEGFTARASP